MAEDLKLSVGLDASSVKKSSSNLKKEIDDIFKQASGKDVSSNFQKLQVQMDKAATRATVLEEKMKELENTKIPTEDYKQLESTFNSLSGQLGKLTDKQIQMQEAGQTTGKAWDGLATKIASVNAELENVTAEMSQMKAEGTAFTSGVDTAQYENLKNQLEGVNNQMRILTSSAYQSGEVSRKAAERTGSVWQNTGRLIKQTFEDLKSGRLFKELGNQGEACAKQISKSFTKLPVNINSFTNALKSSKSHMSGLGNSAGKLVKKILLLGFGIRGLVGLFRKLRSGISEGLQAMAVWNGGNNATNRSISMLISSLNYLKASLATAFAPILNVVAPILSAFMDMLARAAQMVGAFFAALTGKSTYVAAVKNNTNYAASISKSTGKTKKDTKEQKKNTKAKKDNAKATKEQNDRLADFDDLNVLGIETQDDLNDALEDQPDVETPEVPEVPSGGGGGGAPALANFQEKDIPDWINNLVKKIKDAWKNADFTEIGRMVGEKMRDALNKASDWLVNVAQPFAYKLGKSIATFLNGFFETPGLALALGRAIGELINTAVIGINAFLDYTHWDSIGKFFADGLNSAIRFIKWKDIGHMLAQGINALSGMLLGFVQNFDFRGFGSALGEGLTQACKDFDVKQIFASLSEALAGFFEFISGALQGIEWWEIGNLIVQWIADAITGTDWNRIVSAVYEMIGSAFGALLGFAGGIGEKVAEFLKAAWDAAVTYFSGYTNEAGELTIEGFLQGTLDAIKGIGQWIIDNIFNPFIEGFHAAFDMHSPSKVMEELGKDIILGLFNGINSLVQTIIDIFIQLKDTIIAKWEEFKTKFEKITTDIKANIVKIWTELRSKVENIVSLIKTNVSKFWTDLKTKVEELTTKLRDNVKKYIQELRDKVENIISTLKTNFINFWNTIKTTVETIATGIRDKVSEAMQGLHDKTVGPDGWITKLKTKFIELMNGLRDGIKAPLNTILGFFGKLANGVINAINGMIDALNTLSFDVPDWVPEIGGQKFGLRLNRLSNITVPTLAQGAVIPPNKEFLAMLGDQKSGTNIEAPLSTMVDAFKTAMQDMNMSNVNQNAIMTLDGQTFARLMVPYVMDEMNRRGYNTTVLEG